MMKQISLFITEFRSKDSEVTKREKFLSEMNQVIPWPRLVEVIEPFYPKAAIVLSTPTPMVTAGCPS